MSPTLKPGNSSVATTPMLLATFPKVNDMSDERVSNFRRMVV